MLDRKAKITPDRMKSMQSSANSSRKSEENNSFHDGEEERGKRIFTAANGGHFWLKQPCNEPVFRDPLFNSLAWLWGNSIIIQ